MGAHTMLERLPPLWPRRLRHQTLVLLLGVLALALVASALLSKRRIDQAVQHASQQWAEALARTAASAGVQALSGGDRAGLEGTLRDLASLPGVTRIDVVDAAAAPVMGVRAIGNGRTQISYAAVDIERPSPATEAKPTLGADTLRVWVPVGPGGRLGSIGVLFDTRGERAQLERLHYETLGAMAVVSALAFVLVYVFISKALAPLQRLAAFSRDLALHTGRRLTQRAGSQEVANLTEALNDASTRLREHVDAIRGSEVRTHAILNATPDAIVGLDQAGCISLVNPAVTSIFGYRPRDVEGQPLSLLLPKLTPPEIARLTLEGLYMRSSHSYVARLDTTALRHDGTEFPAEVSLARVETEDGERYACVVRDVTEQRMTYAMLNLYNRALECTTNGVVISDMTLPGQPLFYANPAFSTITGYTTSEAIGNNCKMLQGADGDQPEIQLLREAISKGQPATVVLRNYRKDGSLFFNELAIAPVTAADGTVPHYVGVLTDVSERERARFALAERSARLNAVFDLSPDGFVVFDREGHWVYRNQAFLQMTGWSPNTAEIDLADFDRAFQQLCDPAHHYRPVSEVLLGAPSDAPEILIIVRPQQRTLARVVRHNVEGHGESILYFRDITRETEVDRMKSEFLTTAAHELRTPMASIFGFAELMLRRPVPPERQRDVIETIHRQAQLLINMVNELLDLARIEARQGKDFQLLSHTVEALVGETVAALMVNGDARKVQLQVAHGAVPLWVDHDKTCQALTNVLSNAYKYSPAGGDIVLRTLMRGEGDEAQVGIAVKDHGIGLTPSQQARLFERFYRADPSGNIPGTGLGLCLVREIMLLQGGDVEVQSQAGEGTEVTLWFPLASGPRQRSAKSGAAPAQPMA